MSLLELTFVIVVLLLLDSKRSSVIAQSNATTATQTTSKASVSTCSSSTCATNAACVATNVSTYCSCPCGMAGDSTVGGSGCSYLDPDLVDVGLFNFTLGITVRVFIKAEDVLMGLIQYL